MQTTATDLLLIDHGIYIQSINYATVPRGTERMRITPSPNHDDAMIDGLAEARVGVWQRLALPLGARELAQNRTTEATRQTTDAPSLYSVCLFSRTSKPIRYGTAGPLIGLSEHALFSAQTKTCWTEYERSIVDRYGSRFDGLCWAESDSICLCPAGVAT